MTARGGRRLADVLEAVGPRLRALRRRRGVTLAELHAATGISVSTLSRLESGGRRPTLELLLPLARAHGVPIDELVGAPPTGDPRVHLRPVRRGGHDVRAADPAARAGPRRTRSILPPRHAPGSRRATRATSGSTCSTGGCGSCSATGSSCSPPGEAAEFDTHVPHHLSSADDAPVELLVLFGKQGERAHLRARSG